MQCLLDKVTVRHCLTGMYRINADQSLSENELLALKVVFSEGGESPQLFISPSTANLLTQFAHSASYAPSVGAFMQMVATLTPTRYFKRWSRRLREFGFTREDAAILAIGTFGAVDGLFTSVNHIITFDQRMINNWKN